MSEAKELDFMNSVEELEMFADKEEMFKELASLQEKFINKIKRAVKKHDVKVDVNVFFKIN